MKLASLVAVAFALAPMAYAEDCTTLDSVIASGVKDEFEGIFNGEIDDGVFETTLTFERADACEVDSFEPVYYCRWDTGAPEPTDKVILPLYDLAKICLSEGWAWDDLAGKSSWLGAKIIEGYSMTKGDVSARIYMVEQGGGAGRQVWLEVQPD